MVNHVLGEIIRALYIVDCCDFGRIPANDTGSGAGQ